MRHWALQRPRICGWSLARLSSHTAVRCVLPEAPTRASSRRLPQQKGQHGRSRARLSCCRMATAGDHIHASSRWYEVSSRQHTVSILFERSSAVQSSAKHPFACSKALILIQKHRYGPRHCEIRQGRRRDLFTPPSTSATCCALGQRECMVVKTAQARHRTSVRS